MALRKFILLCSHHHHPFPELFFLQTFNTLYLGAKQGSIWTVKKGTSLKIIHHSVVD